MIMHAIRRAISVIMHAVEWCIIALFTRSPICMVCCMSKISVVIIIIIIIVTVI